MYVGYGVNFEERKPRGSGIPVIIHHNSSVLGVAFIYDVETHEPPLHSSHPQPL